MGEWKEYKLGEIADILTGFSFKGEEYAMEGNLKVVRGENVTVGSLRWDTEKHWNHSVEGLEKYFIEECDIVVGMDGSKVGQNRAIIRVHDLPLILAQRVARLRAKKGFDQKFVWYHIFNKRFLDYVDAIHTGTSIPHISQAQIGEFALSAPEIKEQNIIGSVLSSLDDKMDLLQRQNKTLEAMAETLFRQWFVEEAEEKFKNGQVYSIGDLIDTISQTYKFKESEQVVFLNTSDIYAGQVLNHTFCDVATLPGQAKKSIQKNDILYSEIRPENKRYAFIDFDASQYVVSTKLMVLRCNGLISSSLIYFYLTHPQTLNWLHMLADARSGTFPQITFDQVKEMKINLPTGDLLSNITAWTDSTLNKICKNNQQIRTLTSLRDTLLPKLMNGEVIVKESAMIRRGVI